MGDYKITGILTSYSEELYMIDYDKGVAPIGNARSFPSMPADVIEDSRMSLWNVCLEVHTGRFFQHIVGNFYILIVPLTGLVGIMVVISGYLLLRKRNRTKSKNPVN